MKTTIYYRPIHTRVLIVYVVRVFLSYDKQELERELTPPLNTTNTTIKGTALIGDWSAYCVPLEPGQNHFDNRDRWKTHGCKITKAHAAAVYSGLVSELELKGLVHR